uniref:Alternative protein PMEL n=1 Tax=Homo sapiens TaxID=9606 RepID=L8ECD6_HUMAN|nr:alternative protein PMEL [Homo sapiens]
MGTGQLQRPLTPQLAKCLLQKLWVLHLVRRQLQSPLEPHLCRCQPLKS